jgi:beta-lactamase class A
MIRRFAPRLSAPRLPVLRLSALGLLALLGACATAPSRQTSSPAAPPGLEARIADLVHGFDGKVGVAVEAVDEGWTVAYDGRTWFPQQSVSKLCTAIAVLDAVDSDRMRLTDPVRVTRADMSVFNQPIQARLTETGLSTTVGELLFDAIAQSDNAADDILIRRVGGPGVVQRAVSRRGLKGVRCGPEEHVLESRIAGLDWQPEYSFGKAFWEARDKLDPRVRAEKLDAYVRDPEDGARPLALVRLLARLKRGELLSADSTGRLLAIMAQTRTGPLRLPAGLNQGWTIAHKTGTGQDLADLSTGNNDVGLLTAPDGKTYAVAVMIAATRRPVPERQKLMAAIARAVVEAHDGAAARSGGRP